MRRVTFALFLLVLFLPALPSLAKPLNTSTAASTSVSSTISLNDLSNGYFKFNAWLQNTFGIDLYKLIQTVVGFAIVVLRIVVNFLLQILPKIQAFLSK